MRLRYTLLIFFILLSSLPATIFWLWPQTQLINKEREEVRGKHLLLARNLSATLNRYQQDVVSVFNYLTINLIQNNPLPNTKRILHNHSFKHICIADVKTGKVISNITVKPGGHHLHITEEQVKYLLKISNENEVKFSPVAADTDGEPVLFVTKRVNGYLSVGVLATDYFVKLGKSIAFGIKGHAAILDQSGNVLAHPKDSWIAERRNLSKVPTVQRMLNGETDIATFYSPAMNTEMIAGFTIVPKTGWGVMVPQPLKELTDKVEKIKASSLAVFLFGFVLSFIGAIILSVVFARPLETINSASTEITKTDSLKEVNESKNPLIPLELRTLQKNFNMMIRKLRSNIARIEQLAYQDSVTELPNRLYYLSIVKSAMDKMNRNNEYTGCILFIDLDGFKSINDTHGHAVGDDVLILFSRRVSSILTKHSGAEIHEHYNNNEYHYDSATAPIFSRLGGDEFAIFVSNKTGDINIDAMTNDILRASSEPFVTADLNLQISASIGVCFTSPELNNLTSVLNAADTAMYQAKKNGKNNIQIYDARFENDQLETQRIRNGIKTAIRRDQLQVYYQPRYSIHKKEVSGFEALVRWKHPEKGLLLPGAFLPHIETSDLIVELDDWVLEKTLNQLATWQENNLSTNISINISARQLSDPERANTIIRMISNANVNPARIEFEITEDTIINNIEQARSFISRLKSYGCRIALDDFGLGYSNLSRLIQLPFDVLKIDRSLIQEITSSHETLTVTKSLILLANGMKCDLVFEGVETLEQARVLNELNCSEIQGYLISKPLPDEEVLTWWHNKEAPILEVQRLLALNIA